MKFYTHDGLTHKKVPKKFIMLVCVPWVLMYGLFLFIAIVCSFYVHNVVPSLVILIPNSLLLAWLIIQNKDMEKEYVEFIKDTITVVDYRLGIRKVKIFNSKDIVKAEIIRGYSNKVRGYRYSHMGFTYIVFRGVSNKYLFKVVNLPETRPYFESYLIKS